MIMILSLVLMRGCIYIIAREKLLNTLSPNDLFVTLGAGDIWKLGKSLKEKLKYSINVKG